MSGIAHAIHSTAVPRAGGNCAETALQKETTSFFAMLADKLIMEASGVIKKSTAHHDEKTPRCHQLEIYLPTSVIVSSSQLRGHSN